ncbi:MAG: methylmalonyl-CoA epimerase [Clostridia bacterium]|nr:methylmalonyl-CoA epimerase [Clostridia bacterium]
MNPKKIDHIGIAVQNMEEALATYRALGLEASGSEIVPEQKVKVAFLPIGDTRIELLEATAPDSPIAKFIETRGQGVQHIALRVENLENWLEYLKGQGFRLIDEAPRYGAGGARVAFLHPKSTHGTLVELSEHE